MKRNEKIDLLKGIAILLVLVGHAIQQTTSDFLNDSIIAVAIYSFHMHLFFFLSGYLICGKEKKLDFVWLGKQIISLVVPIISWKYIYFFTQSEVTGLNDIWNVFVNWLHDPRGDYWFLWSLFMCEIYFYITKKIHIINRVKIQIATDVLLIMIILAVTHVFNINWGGLRDIYMYLLFYISGYYLHALGMASDEPSAMSGKWGMIHLICPITWMIVFGFHYVIRIHYPTSILNGALAQFIYRILIAYIGIATCWVLSDFVCGKTRCIVSRIGQYTKEIYIIHTAVMPCIIVSSSILISRIFKVVASLGISLLVAWLVRCNGTNIILFGNAHSCGKYF